MSDSSTPPPVPAAGGRRTWADLGPRFISAMVLIAITAASLVLGGYIFAAVIGIVFAGAYREWETMVTLKPLTPFGMALMGAVALSALAYPMFGAFGTMGILSAAAIVALVAGADAALWRTGGLLFFGAVIVSVLAIRGTTTDGIIAGVYLGTVIWSTDTGAFFAGRQVGGEKLAPGISPSKTWSGALGGLIVALILGLAILLVMTSTPWWIALILSGGLSILGQLGDLTESAIKRRFRVKDSGDIIPGHGGLMDRLDSITFGAIAAFLIGALHAGGLGDVARGLIFW